MLENSNQVGCLDSSLVFRASVPELRLVEWYLFNITKGVVMKFRSQFLPIHILPVLLLTALNMLLLAGCGSPKNSEIIASDKASVVQKKTDRVDNGIPEHWTRMDDINNHNNPAKAWGDAIQKLSLIHI